MAFTFWSLCIRILAVDILPVDIARGHNQTAPASAIMQSGPCIGEWGPGPAALGKQLSREAMAGVRAANLQELRPSTSRPGPRAVL
jgi:hypothetical protein